MQRQPVRSSRSVWNMLLDPVEVRSKTTNDGHNFTLETTILDEAQNFADQMQNAWSALDKTGWHWFSYHFHNGPTPFARSILRACASLDSKTDDIGKQLLDDLLSIGGREKDRDQYEQLLQKLAEILVLERIITSDWPDGTTFQYEPEAVRGGPRPELLVVANNIRLAVEVKAPSLLRHIRNRHANGVQLAYRDGVPLPSAREISGGDGLTLPRDYPILDFLKSANRKFEGFRDGETATILVIVWDDYIYEPISVLMNGQSGLLTLNSFERDPETGEALKFENIDAVIAIRHLNYFIMGAGEEYIYDRNDGMDFGGDAAMPNVLFTVSEVRAIPDHIISRLRAYPYGHDVLIGAEYRVQDTVFWV